MHEDIRYCWSCHVSHTFYTVWEGWSNYDAYSGEYDGGTDYVGIIDMNKIEYITREKEIEK